MKNVFYYFDKVTFVFHLKKVYLKKLSSKFKQFSNAWLFNSLIYCMITSLVSTETMVVSLIHSVKLFFLSMT